MKMCVCACVCVCVSYPRVISLFKATAAMKYTGMSSRALRRVAPGKPIGTCMHTFNTSERQMMPALIDIT